jgi:c-di-GMP-binding flagellar brake protein YcgR
MVSTTQEKDQGQSETISFPVRIAAILQPLLQNHTLLNISIAGREEKFSSAFLQIDDDHEFIILDELVPRSINQSITPFTELFIRGQIAGISLSFKTTILDIGTDKEAVFYKVAFPNTIDYRQRRKAFRVPVGVAHSYGVKLILSPGQTLEGELHDISVSGMCVRLPKKTSIPTQWQEKVACELQLPNGKPLKTQFSVCREAQDTHGRNVLLGGLFLHLEKTQERIIEKFVVELQRKARRRMVR